MKLFHIIVFFILFIVLYLPNSIINGYINVIQPTLEIRIVEWGTFSIAPQITTNVNYSSIVYSFKNATGGSLLTDFVYNNGLFSFYSRKGYAGIYEITMNVTVIDRTYRVGEQIFYNFRVIVEPSPTPNTLPILMQDDFADGKIGVKDNSLYNGMTWSVLTGTVGDDMKIYQDDSIVLSGSSLNFNNVTLRFEAYTSWSASRLFLFMFIDESNFYEINLNSPPLQIARTLNGFRTVLLEDTRSELLGLQLASYYGAYKMYVTKSNNKITIQYSRPGFLADYPLTVVDTDSAAYAKFGTGKFGFWEMTPSPRTTSKFKILNMKVYQGKLLEVRTPINYYVDPKYGLDSNNGSSVLTPWKSLTRSQNMLLPGDTLNLFPGLFQEPLIVNATTLESQPITIRAMNKGKTIIEGTTALNSSNWSVFYNSPLLPSTIYSYPIGKEVSYLSQNYSLFLNLAIKPIPPNNNPFYIDNNIAITSSNILPTGAERTIMINSGLEYLFLSSVFRNNSVGSTVTDDYWIGATIYHYSAFSDDIFLRQIIAYNASLNRATVALISNQNEYLFAVGDSYSIGNHPGIISREGEYASVVGVLYMAPYCNTQPKNVVISASTTTTNGITIDSNKEGIIIDGLVVQRFAGNGIYCSKGCNGLKIVNVKASYNLVTGLNISNTDRVYVGYSEFSYNSQNGVNFDRTKYVTLEYSFVHHNNVKGLYIGYYGAELFHNYAIEIKKNIFQFQNTKLNSPKNIQIASSTNITFTDNFIENSESNNTNIFMELCGEVTFIRNLFISGGVGINHSAKTKIYNNNFINSDLRFVIGYENYVPYSSLVALQSVISNTAWLNLMKDIRTQSIQAYTLLWSKNTTFYTYANSISVSTMPSGYYQNQIITFINSVISNLNFISTHYNYITPLLLSNGTARFYWDALIRRGLIDSKGKLSIIASNETEVEEIRGLTRAVLDELAIDGRFYKANTNYYPRTLSAFNNIFVECEYVAPNSTYSLVPYFNFTNNYLNINNTNKYSQWLALPMGKGTTLKRDTNDLYNQFVNPFQNYYYYLLSNSPLINAGVNVGLTYYGFAPDIGANEYNPNCPNTFISLLQIISSFNFTSPTTYNSSNDCPVYPITTHTSVQYSSALSYSSSLLHASAIHQLQESSNIITIESSPSPTDSSNQGEISSTISISSSSQSINEQQSTASSGVSLSINAASSTESTSVSSLVEPSLISRSSLSTGVSSSVPTSTPIESTPTALTLNQDLSNSDSNTSTTASNLPRISTPFSSLHESADRTGPSPRPSSSLIYGSSNSEPEFSSNADSSTNAFRISTSPTTVESTSARFSSESTSISPSVETSTSLDNAISESSFSPIASPSRSELHPISSLASGISHQITSSSIISESNSLQSTHATRSSLNSYSQSTSQSSSTQFSTAPKQSDCVSTTPTTMNSVESPTPSLSSLTHSSVQYSQELSITVASSGVPALASSQSQTAISSGVPSSSSTAFSSLSVFSSTPSESPLITSSIVPSSSTTSLYSSQGFNSVDNLQSQSLSEQASATPTTTMTQYSQGPSIVTSTNSFPTSSSNQGIQSLSQHLSEHTTEATVSSSLQTSSTIERTSVSSLTGPSTSSSPFAPSTSNEFTSTPTIPQFPSPSFSPIPLSSSLNQYSSTPQSSESLNSESSIYTSVYSSLNSLRSSSESTSSSTHSSNSNIQSPAYSSSKPIVSSNTPNLSNHYNLETSPSSSTSDVPSVSSKKSHLDSTATFSSGSSPSNLFSTLHNTVSSSLPESSTQTSAQPSTVYSAQSSSYLPHTSPTPQSSIRPSVATSSTLSSIESPNQSPTEQTNTVSTSSSSILSIGASLSVPPSIISTETATSNSNQGSTYRSVSDSESYNTPTSSSPVPGLSSSTFSNTFPMSSGSSEPSESRNYSETSELSSSSTSTRSSYSSFNIITSTQPSLHSCSIICNHGTCLGEHCKCNEHYLSEHCNVTSCNGVFSNETGKVCSGHGNCVGYNYCLCHNGYSGSDCSISTCFSVSSNNDTVCSGHGSCINQSCVCETGYKGANCSQPICNGNCNDNGKCLSPNTCTCYQGYVGSECNIPVCFNIEGNSTEVCKGRGVCTFPNTCKCLEEYAGEFCQYLSQKKATCLENYSNILEYKTTQTEVIVISSFVDMSCGEVLTTSNFSLPLNGTSVSELSIKLITVEDRKVYFIYSSESKIILKEIDLETNSSKSTVLTSEVSKIDKLIYDSKIGILYGLTATKTEFTVSKIDSESKTVKLLGKLSSISIFDVDSVTVTYNSRDEMLLFLKVLTTEGDLKLLRYNVNLETSKIINLSIVVSKYDKIFVEKDVETNKEYIVLVNVNGLSIYESFIPLIEDFVKRSFSSFNLTKSDDNFKANSTDKVSLEIFDSVIQIVNENSQLLSLIDLRANSVQTIKVETSNPFKVVRKSSPTLQNLSHNFSPIYGSAEIGMKGNDLLLGGKGSIVLKSFSGNIISTINIHTNCKSGYTYCFTTKNVEETLQELNLLTNPLIVNIYLKYDKLLPTGLTFNLYNNKIISINPYQASNGNTLEIVGTFFNTTDLICKYTIPSVLSENIAVKYVLAIFKDINTIHCLVNGFNSTEHGKLVFVQVSNDGILFSDVMDKRYFTFIDPTLKTDKTISGIDTFFSPVLKSNNTNNNNNSGRESTYTVDSIVTNDYKAALLLKSNFECTDDESITRVLLESETIINIFHRNAYLQFSLDSITLNANLAELFIFNGKENYVSGQIGFYNGKKVLKSEWSFFQKSSLSTTLCPFTTHTSYIMRIFIENETTGRILKIYLIIELYKSSNERVCVLKTEMFLSDLEFLNVINRNFTLAIGQSVKCEDKNTTTNSSLIVEDIGVNSPFFFFFF
ncbi:hypothetical protein ABK040_013011 [Willaertia magna]